MSMNITLQDAYAEACQALGEATVRERLIAKENAGLAHALAAAKETVAPETAPSPAS